MQNINITIKNVTEMAQFDYTKISCKKYLRFFILYFSHFKKLKTYLNKPKNTIIQKEMPWGSDAEVGTQTSHLQTLPSLACLQQYTASAKGPKTPALLLNIS